MNCKDAISVVADFLEQSLSPEVLAELERHLSDCAPCWAYLEPYRKTVEPAGRAEHIEMSADMKARLRSLLLDGLGV